MKKANRNKYHEIYGEMIIDRITECYLNAYKLNDSLCKSFNLGIEQIFKIEIILNSYQFDFTSIYNQETLELTNGFKCKLNINALSDIQDRVVEGNFNSNRNLDITTITYPNSDCVMLLYITHKNINDELKKITNDVDEYSKIIYLSGKYDNLNCYLEIHPGAGGTEAQDWAEMLYEMYKKYAEIKQYKFEEVYFQKGDEAGIKSATVIISGDNAYGYLNTHDELTGAHNRRYLETTVANYSIEGKLDQYIAARINLKNFKHINDTYGHLVGDEILINVISVLVTTVVLPLISIGGTKLIELINNKICDLIVLPDSSSNDNSAARI